MILLAAAAGVGVLALLAGFGCWVLRMFEYARSGTPSEREKAGHRRPADAPAAALAIAAPPRSLDAPTGHDGERVEP